ncbi:MAG: C25 family cysteine peptidase [Candidatus Krumholzibacteria bacterium]|nr:C25 family cysteine peptidase [Candidatus Krumholzibacteria bacterium]
MQSHGKRLISGLVPWLFALVAFCPRVLARDGNVSLVSSSSSSVSFEIAVPEARIVSAAGGTMRVLIDGYGTFSPAGAVELPGRAFRIAVPALGEPRVTATVLEEESIGILNLARVGAERFVEGENGIPVTERYYPPDPWADGGGLELVEAGKPSFMGRQRVFPIRVNPLIIDATGARLVRRLAVTVSFGTTVARSRIAALSAEPVPLMWQQLYEDLLVNPADVASFRKPLEQAQAVSAAPGEAGKKLKIPIPETGIYAIRADSLIAAGLSEARSTGEIALKKYYYDETAPGLVTKVDVPILVVEGASGSQGIFDGDDQIIFYALGIKDDSLALDANALYTDNNILWLEEEVAGDTMDQGPFPPAAVSTSVTRFVATMKYRKDAFYMKNAVPGTFDFYYARGVVAMVSSVTFTLNSPASNGTFSLSFRLQGDDPDGSLHTVTFYIRNSTGTHQIGTGNFRGKAAKTFSFSGLASSWLVDGANELVIATDTDYIYVMNDFTINYTALFVADGNRLEFAVPALSEPASIEITGFTVNAGWLIDITDPWSPTYRAISGPEFESDGSQYKLELKIEESASARRFMALGSGAAERVSVKSISVDSPSSLHEETGPYQALIISHGNFIDRMAEYAAMRKSQGYRMLTADVQDVYDEFNGGLANATAIKRYIKYGFDHWGVEFVLLVGDASEDHKRLYIGSNPEKLGSPPDYVPSFSYSTDVTGTYDDEVVSSDKWYAFLDEAVMAGSLTASVEDILAGDGYPDVIIGRLPVGRDVELRAILNKIYRMEAPESGDAWRRRIVLFSDDAWSGRGSDYRYNSYERTFEDSTESCGKTVEEALPGGFDVKRLYLRPYTNSAHPDSTASGAAIFSEATAKTRAAFTPALNAALNGGCFWYMFEGHANRTVLTTESAYALGWYMDIDSLKAYTPFIFTAFGCHISDFAILKELSAFPEAGAYGDCFSEQLLFKPGVGAVATYASVGYEYLSDNAELAGELHRTFFQSPPTDSVEPLKEYTGAHWILGEAITNAEMRQIDKGGKGMVLRYTLLGDPMLKIDPGPPLIRFEADWGDGYEVVSPDTIRAHNGTNAVGLRLTASDIVAIGKITLQINGEDCTDSLLITRLMDADKTYSRSYRADLDYTIDPKDELLVFKVFTPDGRESGVVEVPIKTTMRLYYNNYLEIVSGIEAPSSGTFQVKIDFPAYLAQEPALSIDGVPQGGTRFAVTDPQDSLHWEASFDMTFTPGLHVLTVRTGDFSRDLDFTVTGNELVVDAFNFPNPFSDRTNIVYSLNLAADAVTIDIYSVSGLLIRRLDLPQDRLAPASLAQPHSVLWDGRDLAGDRVANGTYLYVIRVRRAGETIDLKGKIVKLE